MKKILLVEDDKKIALAMATRLRAFGFGVVVAGDAVFAMDEAMKCKPDVILLDINLPGGSGFVVASRLRESLQFHDVPIVFITASKQRELREKAVSIGASGFLEKPFSADQLADAIDVSLACNGPGFA